MEYQSAQPIGEILNQYLKLSQVENLVFGERIAQIWQETLGDDVTLATERIFLQNGTLYITLKSPSLKSDLMMRRSFIANALNQKLEKEIIKQVVFN